LRLTPHQRQEALLRLAEGLRLSEDDQ